MILKGAARLAAQNEKQLSVADSAGGVPIELYTAFIARITK
jgi:hypothetical protein